jgi:hypothetical protein
MAELPDLNERDYPRGYSKDFREKLRKSGREKNSGNRNYRFWYGDSESKNRDSSDVNVGEQRVQDSRDTQPRGSSKKRAVKKRGGKKRSGKKRVSTRS